MTTEQAKKIIDDVVSSDGYSAAEVEIPSWVTKALKWVSEKIGDFLEWIGDLLEGIIDKLNPGAGNGGDVLKTIGWVIVSLLAAFLLFVIVFVVLKLLKTVNRNKKTETDDTEELVRLSESPDEAWRLYEENLANGNLREAFRYLFISLLVQLNKRELIRIRKYKTNRVYKAEILELGRFSEGYINEFFLKFNYVRFAHRPISAEELDAMYQKYLVLLEQADGKSTGKGGEEG